MVKTLFGSLREYKLPALLCPVFMACEAAIDIVIPFLMTFVIRELENLSENTAYTVDRQKIAALLIAMLLCALFALFVGIIGGSLASKASSGFAHNLREDLYAKIQSFSFANLDRFSAASLITRVTTDVTNVQTASQICLRTIVRAPMMVLVSILMTCLIEPSVSLVFLAATILISIIVTLCMTKALPHFKKMFAKYDDLNLVVEENLTAIRVVKSYVREKREMEKMNDATTAVYQYDIRAEKILTFMTPCVTGVMFLLNIVVLLTGSQMTAGTLPGRITAADLQTLITYSTQILNSILLIAMNVNALSIAQGSMGRIYEVLKEEPTLCSPENPVHELKDGSIEFCNVQFSYTGSTENCVLQDINLTIASGETVGIIGGTGSGKSTLVSLIPRLYDVTQGEVKVGGMNVRNYDLHTLRGKVAMVLQNNVLFSGSVAENLRWGDENATDEDLRSAAEQAQAAEFIDAFPEGFSYDLGQGGVNVSGGQKQRLCIARALLKKPDVIIFDDSTSAVDTKTDARIRSALKKFAPQITKIIIAQRVSSVQDADRIVLMEKGRIVSVGTHEELLRTSEIYRDLCISQMQGSTDAREEVLQHA